MQKNIFNIFKHRATDSISIMNRQVEPCRVYVCVLHSVTQRAAGMQAYKPRCYVCLKLYYL